jgi:hypothetical protein
MQPTIQMSLTDRNKDTNIAYRFSIAYFQTQNKFLHINVAKGVIDQ